jgi:hypothetical protein
VDGHVVVLQKGATYDRWAKRRLTTAPAAVIAPSARPIRFVWTHVRQALQQTAAVGACSPYFAVACTTLPVQTVFTEEA